MSTRYAIYQTAFHGGTDAVDAPYYAPGRLMSRHRSEHAAIRAYLRATRAHGDCQCGGPVVTVDGAPAYFAAGQYPDEHRIVAG